VRQGVDKTEHDARSRGGEEEEEERTGKKGEVRGEK
jgi:hypothetical protein